MLVLAIDTSTADLIVGLVRTDATAEGERKLVGQVIVEDCRKHNELLTPTTLSLLADAGLRLADVDAIVVGCGPGPFTGLRVGMATAAAFGDALGIPVFGVCSLDAAAYGIEGTVLVASDARRKEVYWAAYDGGRRVAGPDVIRPEQLDPQAGVKGFDTVSITPSLASRLPQALKDCTLVHTRPLPLNLVAVADLSATPGPLVPLYLRRPDATEPAPRPQSPAIPKVDLDQ